MEFADRESDVELSVVVRKELVLRHDVVEVWVLLPRAVDQRGRYVGTLDAAELPREKGVDSAGAAADVEGAELPRLAAPSRREIEQCVRLRLREERMIAPAEANCIV